MELLGPAPNCLVRWPRARIAPSAAWETEQAETNGLCACGVAVLGEGAQQTSLHKKTSTNDTDNKE